MRKTAEWVRNKYYTKAIICSNCGTPAPLHVHKNHWTVEHYCPHCGRPMRNKNKLKEEIV